MGHLFLVLLFNKSIVLPVNVYNIAGRVANNVDPDQTPRSAASDLVLHCLLRPVCPNTYSTYGNMIKSNPSEILLDPPLGRYGSKDGPSRRIFWLSRARWINVQFHSHLKMNKYRFVKSKTNIYIYISSDV